ncbi:uncharacterized protein VTP21DRAFT_6374 [Calcarisporiella thermophila]|uniref:uncharacterized protein n=1 Tax=Calcarisporiella thermophila TaxID=911321 RepID=UPI003743F243
MNPQMANMSLHDQERAPRNLPGQEYVGQMQRRTMQCFVPILSKAAKEVPLHTAAQVPYVVVDYGCNGGFHSMPPVAAVVRAIENRSTNTLPNFMVYHADLPMNEFGPLFGTLHSPAVSYMFELRPHSQQQQHPHQQQHPEPPAIKKNIFPAAIGRSLFEPCLPPLSVDYGFCLLLLAMVHNPPPLERALVVHSPLASSQERNAWRAAARKELVDFLNARADEFRAGGQLILSVGAEGGERGESVMLRMEEAVLELVESGKIPNHVKHQMVVPGYSRSEAEVREAVDAVGKFRIREIKSDAVVHPAWEAFQQNSISAKEYVEVLVEYARPMITNALVHGMMQAGVMGPMMMHPSAQIMIQQLTDEIMGKARAKLERDPKPFTSRLLLVWLERI